MIDEFFVVTPMKYIVGRVFLTTLTVGSPGMRYLVSMARAQAALSTSWGSPLPCRTSF